MADLLDTPLSASEIERLPEKLRRRLWAAEISNGVPGLSALDRQEVRHECRALIAWRDRLGPDMKARYVGIASDLKSKICTLHAIEADDASVSFDGFADRFLVDPLDLEPI